MPGVLVSSCVSSLSSVSLKYLITPLPFQFSSFEEHHNIILLTEYSAVTYGANEDTPVVGMKSSKSLLERLETISKVLKKGTLTDEGFKQLQVEYEQLKAYILKSLETESQPSNDTTEEVKPIDLVKLFKQL